MVQVITIKDGVVDEVRSFSTPDKAEQAFSEIISAMGAKDIEAHLEDGYYAIMNASVCLVHPDEDAKEVIEFDHLNVVAEFTDHLIFNRIPFSVRNVAGNYTEVEIPYSFKEEAYQFLDNHFEDGEVIDQDSDGYILWNADNRTTYCSTDEIDNLTPAEKRRIER